MYTHPSQQVTYLALLQYSYSSQHSGTFSVGVVGMEDVDLSSLNFTYVSAISFLSSVGVCVCVVCVCVCVCVHVSGECVCVCVDSNRLWYFKIGSLCIT